MTFSEFDDPRLVALYDRPNPTRRDTAFYLALADEREASRIIDLGCGTGAITCELARRGHTVTGVDPAAEMLRVARAREGGQRVDWVEGEASALAAIEADLAIMTGHVAQVIHDEVAWQGTLAALQGCLVPGGRIAFESRSPAAEAWLRWVPETSFERLDDTPLGSVEVWFELLDVDGDLVRYEIHYRFAASGEELVSSNMLRFRSEDAIVASLDAAGFTVDAVFGDWDRSSVGAGSPELIFVASRD